MKKSILIIGFAFFTLAVSAQKKIGWFITPEVGTMFHEDHVGKTVGASFGIQVWQKRLKIGIHTYGRSGPINSKTFTVDAANGQTYKGSSTLTVRADHLAFGLIVAPTFNVNNWQLDVPINFGTMGAGFYFAGEDRNTPDGERVSVWENRLMDERDAGFGTWIEVGIRAIVPTKNEHIQWGAGVHYLMTPGWETYFDPSGDFYNNTLRASLFINFQSGN